MVTHVRCSSGHILHFDRKAITLAGLGGLFLFAYWELVGFDPARYYSENVEGIEGALFSPAGSSPLLIFGVAALLLYSRIPMLRGALGNPPRTATGVALLTPAAALFLWAHYASAPDLLIPSLTTMLVGAGIFLGGAAGLRAVWVPAVFLLFALPMPAAVVNQVVWPLQLATAQAAVWLFGLLGPEPILHGDIIQVGKRSFEIIETCSGLRMIETLAMAAALYSILFFRNRRQVVILLLCSPLIGFAVNQARVLSIILNPYSEWGSIHTLQGIITLVAGVLMIAGLDRLLSRVLSPPPSTGAHVAPRPTPGARQSLFRPLALGLLLVMLGLARLTIPPWQPGRLPPPVAFDLPERIAGSPAKGLPAGKRFLGSVMLSRWTHREYEVDGQPVRLFVGADNRLDKRSSLLSPKTAVPGPGWGEVEKGQARLGVGGPAVDCYVFESQTEQALVYHWYEGIDEVATELFRNAVGLDRSPLRRPSWAVAVRVSTPIAPSPNGRAGAEARLQSFVQSLREALE